MSRKITVSFALVCLVLLSTSVFAGASDEHDMGHSIESSEHVVMEDTMGHSIETDEHSTMDLDQNASEGSDAHGNEADTHGSGEYSLKPALLTAGISLLLFVALILFFRRVNGKDLLEYNTFNKFMKSKWYPAIFQIPTLIFFFFIFYYLFWGASQYANNPGSVLAWTLWWPLIPLVFILLGRIWCMACPIPMVSDFIQRFVKPTRKPGAFIVKYGIWITDGIFIAITLFDRLYGMVETPWLSGIVFLLLILGAISLSVRYERRTFCKHFCFLGGVSGNYSMLSGFSIESKDKVICATCPIKACYFGSGKVEGCPYANIMPAKQGMRNCTLCANCIKACPKNNIALRFRPLASELWSHAKVSFSESFFAKLMVGIVIIQNMGMLAIWSGMVDSLMSYGMGEKMAIAVLYFIAIAIPLTLMTITSFFSSRLSKEKHSLVQNFAAFGYAFIPIDVAGHLAHNLFHLLEEGKSIIGAFLGLFTGNVTTSGALAGPSTIKGLQYALIIAGGIGTLYVAYRIAKQKEGSVAGALKMVAPHALLLLVVFGVNIFLFIAKMEHRG